ncbi:MAG: TorF family putative porin [Pseudooceanicola sp.]|nr:TorF family putative porin [Planctomycetota bacterium]MCB1341661.1 TorF family putative porin [Pseudooceanicola sp.]
MRKLLAASALAACLTAPGLASAQDLSISAGFSLVSRYVSNGFEQTTGGAFQPWIEAEMRGFYLGLWLSNTDDVITGSDYEVDVYLGYRGEVGKFSYDIGYARYYYKNPHVDCCGEVYLSLGYAVTDAFNVGLAFAHDPVADYVDTTLSMDYAFNDKFGVAAEYGSVSNGGVEYWKVGGTYTINDKVSITGAWHDNDLVDGIFVVSLDTSFSLR